MEFLYSFENWAGIVTLAAMLITLDLDNVVFISVLAGKLPENEREKARRYGLFAGMFMRIGLLLGIQYLLEHLQFTLFTILEHPFNGKAIIMMVGGLFLLTKATLEIHNRTEGTEKEEDMSSIKPNFSAVFGQIMLLDMVFSIDSIITAVGMTESKWTMIGGVIISMMVMYIFARGIGAFIQKHPTMKMLALSFLLLIGVLLVAESIHVEFSKSYIYFAMAFSMLVEFLNLRSKKNNPHLFHPH